ncbi:MAG: type II secretion system protein [Desulforhabdus sp.]|jgi:hypothetical protein|nr:type II secretion system protein [Desulforhabdus sp.]
MCESSKLLREEIGSGPRRALSQCGGFTLVELVLATLISTLVVGIMALSLSFSLRVWARQQDRTPSEVPMILELMALQLANFDPTPLSSEFGATAQVFSGDESSLALATDHSVKALSKGVPVVARYVYLPKDKILYSAEIPMDPYHHEPLREFLEMKPNDDEDSWPRFFPVEVEEFSIEYSEEGEGDYQSSWDDTEKLPKAVLIKWKIEDNSFSRLMLPGLPFSPATEGNKVLSAPGGS